MGKYTGFGGKLEPGETPAEAAIRELDEETGLKVREEDLEPLGQVLFDFPARPVWSQVVHLFAARRWTGRLRESREMRPVWFSVHEIPFGQMWEDGSYWLPRILAGETIQMRFRFQGDNETIDCVETEACDPLNVCSTESEEQV